MDHLSQNHSGYVCVYRGDDQTTPYLMHHWLIHNGIESVVLADLTGCGGEIPIQDAWPSVWVKSAQRTQAMPLVLAFNNHPMDGEDWTCESCEDVNPFQFASCWKCGSDHPDPTSEPQEAH